MPEKMKVHDQAWFALDPFLDRFGKVRVTGAAAVSWPFTGTMTTAETRPHREVPELSLTLSVANTSFAFSKAAWIAPRPLTATHAVHRNIRELKAKSSVIIRR